MARSIQQQVATRSRQRQAIEMRQHGSTYADIANQLGYSGAGAAWKAVQRGLLEIGREEARALAVLQQGRLDDLLSEAWPVATDPTHPRCLQAIEISLKIMDRMNRLAGLSGPA